MEANAFLVYRYYMELDELSPSYEDGQAGGQEVIIRGGYFDIGYPVTCYFGDIPSSDSTILDAYTIRTVTPAVPTFGFRHVVVSIEGVNTTVGLNYEYRGVLEQCELSNPFW